MGVTDGGKSSDYIASKPTTNRELLYGFGGFLLGTAMTATILFTQITKYDGIPKETKGFQKNFEITHSDLHTGGRVKWIEKLPNERYQTITDPDGTQHIFGVFKYGLTKLSTSAPRDDDEGRTDKKGHALGTTDFSSDKRYGEVVGHIEDIVNKK